MYRCLRCEIKKAFLQKKMLAVALILGVLSLFHAKEAITTGLNALTGNYSGNPQITSGSAFVHWLGADTGSFESTAFFFLLPVFAALPYGWSLAGELQSRYTGQMISRCGRKEYFFAKMVSSFLSGMAIVVAPLLLNFLVVSMFLPSLTPELCYPYGGLLQRSLWSGIYYTHPLIYVMLYILLDGLYGGAFAVLGTVSSFFLKYRIMALLFPFCLYMVLEYLDSNFVVYTGIGYDCSPAKFLRAMAVANEHSGAIIAAEFLLLTGVSLAVMIYRGKHYEVL